MNTKKATDYAVSLKMIWDCQGVSKGEIDKLGNLIEVLQQGEKLKERLTEFLERENPYSEDVFLVIRKGDFVKINNFFKKELGYPMDRLSGNVGRKIYKTIIEDLRMMTKCT